MASESDDPHDMAPDNHHIAVLLIDVINHFEFEGNEEILKVIEKLGQNIATLKEAARKVNIPVIYVNDNFGKWQSDFRTVIDYVIKENKPGKVLAKLLPPKDDDYFVLKPKHSGFFCTPLELLLNHLGTETLIIAGFAGNICVLFTANDAYMRNFKLIIPSDCIGSETSEENDACLKEMKRTLKADTRSSSEVIKDF